MVGLPAARVTDDHSCPKAEPGAPPKPHVGGPIETGCVTVLIGGLPAARVTDKAFCTGPTDEIQHGSKTVIIGGQNAARLSDKCIHGGAITEGCYTVLIG
jgi:uncharacterized Zn-binding protein involved in type VI secretion